VTFKPDESLRDQWDRTSLNYTVALEDLALVSDGRTVPNKAIVRTDNGEILGVAGPQWRPMQPHDVRDILEELVDDDTIALHTAGSLKNGRRMWAQCTINGHDDTAEIVKGDEIRQFYTIAQGLDYVLGVHCGFTRIRTVCDNTLQASMAEGRFVRIKHNRLVVDNVRQLIDSIDWSTQELSMSIEKYQFLAKRGCRPSDLRKYVRLVLDVKPEVEWDDLHSRSQNIVRRVEQLFETGKGNDNPHAKGTWWAAYNGMTEYLSHERGRTAENRQDTLWFGTGRKTLDVALKAAVRFADASTVA